VDGRSIMSGVDDLEPLASFRSVRELDDPDEDTFLFTYARLATCNRTRSKELQVCASTTANAI